MGRNASSLSPTCGFLLAIAFLISATLLTGGETVRIKYLRVPEVVQNGSEAPVILDCDYNLENKEGLVVKWFFNNHPAPVYQWILHQKPQDLGVLKGKLNLDYRASEDEAKKHRALQIIRPTTELSGEYRCIVSTFDGEDSEAKKMVIYVPERIIELKHTKPNDDRVKVVCSAEGVYPEPKMVIKTNGPTSESSRKHPSPTEEVKENDGLFDITVTVVIEDRELQSPTTFDCELSIPEANYTVRRSSVYYPGPPTTTTPEAPMVESTSNESFLANDSSNSSSGHHMSHWILPTVFSLLIVVRL